MATILIIAAVVLAVWAALVDAGHVEIGAPFQLLALAIACGFAAALPLPTFRRRIPRT